MKKYIICFSILSFLLACNKDKIEITAADCNNEFPTYQDVKSILDDKCGTAGCHVGGSSPASFYGNYDVAVPYLNLEPNGFKNRVIEIGDMPEVNSPGQLTVDEKDLLDCWIQGGYAKE